jgi:hypothetical protein
LPESGYAQFARILRFAKNLKVNLHPHTHTQTHRLLAIPSGKHSEVNHFRTHG